MMICDGLSLSDYDRGLRFTMVGIDQIVSAIERSGLRAARFASTFVAQTPITNSKSAALSLRASLDARNSELFCSVSPAGTH
jgi:hypothetical protein